MDSFHKKSVLEYICSVNFAYCLIDFNIDESRLATQKEEIQNTADLINSHEFNKNESSYCNICEFLKYCNG